MRIVTALLAEENDGIQPGKLRRPRGVNQIGDALGQLHWVHLIAPCYYMQSSMRRDSIANRLR
jgi:hypothetical protein